MTLAKSYTITVDTRERKPLPFPPFIVMKKPGDTQAPATVALKTVREKLYAGDYSLRGIDSTRLIETKRGLGELYQNLFTNDRGRFEGTLQRMIQSSVYPVILVENTLSQLLKPSKDYPEPFVILDELQRVCYSYNIPVLLAPASKRLLTGEYVARLLINATL